MQNDKLYFNLAFFTILIFGLSFLFALVGFFYPLLILLLAIVLFFSRRRFSSEKFKKPLNNWELIAATSLFLISLYVFIGFSPSYLGGRDPGAMVEAATMLSKNNRLEFSPRTLEIFDNQDSNSLALNYPGFILTKKHSLKTQFNIGYISFLAFWYSLLGEIGLKIAGLFGITLGFWGLLSIIKAISKNRALAFTSLPLLFLTFPFFWQTRQNLAEPLAFGFLFFAIYGVIKFRQSKKPSKNLIFLILLSLGCFALIRIEGILILAIALFLLSKISTKKGFSVFNKRLFGFLVIMGMVFLLYSLSIAPFYKKLIKDLLGYGKESSGLLEEGFLEEQFKKTSYVLRVFFRYGMFFITLLGFAKIVTLIFKLFKKKEPLSLTSSKVIPLALGGPFLIYFLFPMISLDHPWMLRRFMFACIPLLTIYAVLFVFETVRNKRLVFILLALMTLAQMNIFLNYGFLKKNPDLKVQLEALAQEFGKEDLILVDKSSSFNDWSLISEPLRYLFNRNSVYIYNPQDIEKIPPKLFSKTYLIASKRASLKYQEFIDPKEDPLRYSLNFKQLKVKPFQSQLDYDRPLSFPLFVSEDKTFFIYKLK